MRRSLRTLIDDRERGVALVLVVGVGALLAVLVVAAVSLSLGGLRKARADQDWSAAMAAAYAGVEEYQSRLAKDTGYYVQGNPASAFSNPGGLTPGPVVLPTGAATNPAFGLGVGGTWAAVPGSQELAGGPAKAEFRYEVDNSRYASEGALRLRSTGRAGGETRTIVADLKQQGFIDYMYFTDYEVTDPQALDPQSTLNCAYRWTFVNGCNRIFFGDNDVIRGALHTNDVLLTNGAARFEGKTTTGWKASSGPNYARAGGAAPVFSFTGDPEHKPIIAMPVTNSLLKKETRTDLADVPHPGCLYTGPTSITFHDDGTMQVISPWTRMTRTSNATDTAGTSAAACGTPGDSGLGAVAGGAYVGQRVPILPNMVVYVQNVPSTSGNVNASPAGATPPGAAAVSCQPNGNAIGYPVAGEELPFPEAYGCRNGDAFVRGTLQGRVTVAAENYIYATGDVVLHDEAQDMLGLIGNNAVWVWNPMTVLDHRPAVPAAEVPGLQAARYDCTPNPDGTSTCRSFTAMLTDTRRTLHAAILSVAHTFMVQNYDRGPDRNRGTLEVKGSIAQKFRGPVGTSSGGAMTTGYAKDYRYDDRFKYLAPPKFLSPVTTTYGVSTWVEVSPAMNVDGSAR